MSLRLKFEYYPKIDSALLKDANKFIQENKEKWDSPFFTDTKSHIDIEKIQRTTKHVMNKNLRNVSICLENDADFKEFEKVLNNLTG